MATFLINEKNLIHNVNFIKNSLKRGVKLCAMIKAQAYGHDACLVASILEKHVHYFGVAKIMEGIELRIAGIKTPILCVGTFTCKELHLAHLYNIDVCVHNMITLENVLNFDKNLRVHIKIDTGMTRLGFKHKNEVFRAFYQLYRCKKISIVGVFSHFYNAKSHKDAKLQFDTFKNLTSFIPKKIIRHIASSNACLNKKYMLGMVRVGMLIYGYGLKELKPVLSITSEVVDIHKLLFGQSVSYDACFKAEKQCYIATIPFGYADGMDMRYSGAYVIINNKKFKIVGKICMDMFMVLVDNDVKVGDKVTILYDANYLAEYSGKSVYEVLSNFKMKRCDVLIER